MSYRAVSNRIVLIPEKSEAKIDGILIPDASKNKPKRGIVESVGPLTKEIRIGYDVMFLEGHGAVFHEDGVDKIVLQESDVLCYNSDQREIVFFPGEAIALHMYDAKDAANTKSIRATGDAIFDIISKEIESNPSTLIARFQ